MKTAVGENQWSSTLPSQQNFEGIQSLGNLEVKLRPLKINFEETPMQYILETIPLSEVCTQQRMNRQNRF
jgi:hypothetical protein